MFFSKPSLPPAHFRRFVAQKLSWQCVWEHLVFRPKTTHISLRRQSIDASTEAAFRSSYLLLAAEYFDMLIATDKRLISVAGEEVILLECLAFSSSAVCNKVNPESEEYEMFQRSRHSLTNSFCLMSLLDEELIENTATSRFDLYDEASSALDRDVYLGDTNARIFTYLANGEISSSIVIRREDPANLIYQIAARSFLNVVDGRLKEMFSRIVKREQDEEYSF